MTRVALGAAARAALWFAVALQTAAGAPAGGAIAVAAWAGGGLVRGQAPPALGWLGALATWLVEREPHPGRALLAGTVAATLGALALVERRGGRAGLAGAALAALCLLDALAPGNAAFEWLLAAAFLVCLERGTWPAAAAGGALALAWCNLSGSGLLATGFALADLAGRRWEGASSAAALRPAGALLALAALAACATPAGLAYPALAVRALFLDPSASGTVASAPAAVAPHAYRLGFAAVLLAAALVGFGLRRARDVALALASVGFALVDGRLLPFFGIAVAPLVARSLAGAVPASWPTRGSPRWVVVATAAGALALALARPVPGPGPVLASAFAPRRPAQRLFCERLDWCSLAVANDVPGLRVFADGRPAAYEPQRLAAQSAIAHVRPGWKRLLRDERIGEVLAARDSPLASLLALDPRWQRLGSNAEVAFFRREAAR